MDTGESARDRGGGVEREMPYSRHSLTLVLGLDEYVELGLDGVETLVEETVGGFHGRHTLGDSPVPGGHGVLRGNKKPRRSGVGWLRVASVSRRWSASYTSRYSRRWSWRCRGWS